jgi:AcrR family transcriptional regulator
MQVVTCMKRTGSSVASTRERLLAAAARVYVRAGLTGATTREIAEEAGVNEVTLFRHFKTKDRLLAAVVGDNFGEKPASEQFTTPESTNDLRKDLLKLAKLYEKLLTANLPLVRTMLGELQHHGREHEQQVFRSIFIPLKAAINARLTTAHAAGQLRKDTSPEMLQDLLGGMIFMGVLRRSISCIKISYTASTYLETAVDLVLRGNAPDATTA